MLGEDELGDVGLCRASLSGRVLQFSSSYGSSGSLLFFWGCCLNYSQSIPVSSALGKDGMNMNKNHRSSSHVIKEQVLIRHEDLKKNYFILTIAGEKLRPNFREI